MTNYCPVSLLPLWSKIFERIMFNPVSEFLEKKTNYFPLTNQVFH